MRMTGTVSQSDVRNLNEEQRSTHLRRLHEQCNKLYGPGIFHHVSEANGDISWQYDYAEAFVSDHGIGQSEPLLTDEQVAAIRRAKVIMANSVSIKLVDGKWAALDEDHLKQDPALAGRIEDLNILDDLLSNYEAPASGQEAA